MASSRLDFTLATLWYLIYPFLMLFDSLGKWHCYYMIILEEQAA